MRNRPKKKRVLTARSPAKLILSGEHSVVHGYPAIAMAVDRYAQASVSITQASALFFSLDNLKYAKSLTFDTLKELKNRIQTDYRAFLSGQGSIRAVLEKPFELLQFSVMHLLEKLDISSLEGLNINSRSDIPIGCGMGSSAATIVSTLKALLGLLRVEISPARFLSLSQDAENMQHGRSSGLDLHLSIHGGAMQFEKGKTRPIELSDLPMTLIQTGQPSAHTGECVEQVATHFENSDIGKDFKKVTERFSSALSSQNKSLIEQAISDNHALLVKIGVVPKKVQDFISALNKKGIAAKICGAGSVYGENAGMVLALTSQDLSQYSRDFGYDTYNVKPDLHGTKLL